MLNWLQISAFSGAMFSYAYFNKNVTLFLIPSFIYLNAILSLCLFNCFGMKCWYIMTQLVKWNCSLVVLSLTLRNLINCAPIGDKSLQWVTHIIHALSKHLLLLCVYVCVCVCVCVCPLTVKTSSVWISWMPGNRSAMQIPSSLL